MLYIALLIIYATGVTALCRKRFPGKMSYMKSIRFYLIPGGDMESGAGDNPTHGNAKPPWEATPCDRTGVF